MTRKLLKLLPIGLCAVSLAGCGPEGSDDAPGNLTVARAEKKEKRPYSPSSPSPTASPSAGSSAGGSYGRLSGKVLLVEGDELALGAGNFSELYRNAHPELTVHNLASNRATISDLQARQQMALALRPDVLTISLGIHGLCNSANSDEYVAKINEYVKPFRDLGTKIIVATPLPRDSATENDCDYNHRARLNSAINRIFNGTVNNFDSVLHFAGDDQLGDLAATTSSQWYSDGVHPSEDGQRRLFAIYDRVLDNVWSYILGIQPKFAPSDDGELVIVAEGSSSAITSKGNFNGLYRDNNSTVDEWHGSAVGGSTVEKLIARMPGIIMKNPDVVSVYIGSNDLGGYSTVDSFAYKLRLFAEPLRQRGIKVLFATLPGRATGSVDFDANHNRLRKQMAQVFASASWLDGYADFAAHPVMGTDDAPRNTELFADGLHATPLGHNYLFQAYKPSMDAVIAASAPARR
jgi:lysophospholipase L1-like esterase